MHVAFTTEARRDIRAIAIFIAADSPTRAAQFSIELEAACFGLVDHPKRYALLPKFEALGYRRRPLGQYAIIYVAAGDIQIVRVLHSAMDMDAALG